MAINLTATLNAYLKVVIPVENNSQNNNEPEDNEPEDNEGE